MGSSQDSTMYGADLLEAVFRDLCPWVLRMTRHAGLAATDGWDVVQKLAVVLVEKSHEYDPAKATRRAWGLGIARNLVLDALRAQRTERERLVPLTSANEIPDPSLTPEETLRARETLGTIVTTVREAHRDAMELCAFEHTATEIAGILGVSRDTAEWKLKEARKDLRRALARLGEDRRSVTRLRAVVWPLFVLMRLLRSVLREMLAACSPTVEASGVAACDPRSRRRARLFTALLLTTVPALLSVHLVRGPFGELRVREGWLAVRRGPPGGTETDAPKPIDAPRAPDASPSGSTPTAAEVPRTLQAGGVSRPPVVRTPGRRSGLRSWMVYRAEVAAAHADPEKQGAPATPSPAGPQGEERQEP